ncbi:NlpC/P60 family protein [Lichenifustis flavocetrariae]
MPRRDDIVRAARRYIGTPYHHQAALAGAGCDCLGLIRGVWRDLYGAEPEVPPPYTPDWGETGPIEHMLAAAARHLVPIAVAEADAGDVMIFRLRNGVIAKHAAILTSRTSMIHAQSQDRVREVTMNGWWLRHAAAAFGFPPTVP